MKVCIIISLFLLTLTSLRAQSPSPEEVIGKVYMANGSNITIQGNKPLPGHNLFDPSDPPKNIPPANFQSFDGNMMKVFDVVKSVPDLNPPVGFDAKFQMESFHREAGGMYYGWLRIWMFPYYSDLATKKNTPSQETGLMVWIYVNDLTQLCGNHQYFSDTIRQMQLLPDGLKTAERLNGKGTGKIEIIQKTKALFAPYTIGAFLSAREKYYQRELKKWRDELAEAQKNTSQLKPSGSSNVLDAIDENIANYQKDITERQAELKTATGSDKNGIQSIIDGDKKMLASQEKIRKQMVADNVTSQQNSFNNSLADTYKKETETSQNKVNGIEQKLKQNSVLYHRLSQNQKQQQAYIKSGCCSYCTDNWDGNHITLLAANNHNGIPLFQYNPDYFDKRHHSDIQLIILAYETEGNEEIPGKQREIIKQMNTGKLGTLISN